MALELTEAPGLKLIDSVPNRSVTSFVFVDQFNNVLNFNSSFSIAFHPKSNSIPLLVILPKLPYWVEKPEDGERFTFEVFRDKVQQKRAERGVSPIPEERLLKVYEEYRFSVATLLLNMILSMS